MLHKASELIGSSIAAKDGDVGSVTDLLFDDESWSVRWLVVDTGTWLPGRKVLLPSSHLVRVLPAARGISVDLTREQVKSSPDVDTDQPVSRQMEARMYDHYGSTPYWPAGAGLGAPMAGYPGYIPPAGYGYVAPAPTPVEERVGYQPRRSGDPHLRSASEVTGYHIQGSDDEFGHVADLLVDSEGWSIRYLIIDTKNWWPGKHVLVAPSWVEAIDWGARVLRMRHTRDEIRNAPEYDPTLEIERDYESKLHRYYGRSEYWQ
jgi:sporulation protein YlmC with PRC-barrel domain